MTSFFLKTRRVTAFSLNRRKTWEIPENSGSSTSSSGGTTPSVLGAKTVPRLVRAPVGQEIMHSPQETHDELPISESRSKAIRDSNPLFIRPMTWLFLMSLQPRTHRSQRMQAEWSTAMTTEESSWCRTGALVNRGGPTSYFSAISSSSQSWCSRCFAQGEGWSVIKSSVSVLTESRTLALVSAVLISRSFISGVICR